MEDKKVRKVHGLETIREQIMTFACSAHAFGVELDEFDPDTAWDAIFIVHFQGTDREERFFCRAVKGEQHIRFWVEATLDEAAWRDQSDQILKKVANYDVAVSSMRKLPEEQKRLVRLSTRAWVPNFSQRIFGLTFSNLMNCKAALD